MTTPYHGGEDPTKETPAGPKEGPGGPKAEKKPLDPVVTGEVKTKKRRRPGRKLKEVMIATDLPSLTEFVIYDIVVPQAKALFVDMVTGSANRAMWGLGSRWRSGGAAMPPQMPGQASRFSMPYGGRVNRPGSGPMPPPHMGGHQAPPQERGPRRSSVVEDYILSSKEEALTVLERMGDCLRDDGVVTVAQLKQLCGQQWEQFTDDNWGWMSLPGANVVMTSAGYTIQLPPPQALTQ